MKKQILNLCMTAIICTFIFIPAALADHCCPHERESNVDHQSEVNGYTFEYHFIDIKEKMKAMKGMAHQMEAMAATHHLMVYIKNKSGEPVSADKVGFLITGPDGKVQKVMAMGMNGGYGADIDLSQKGAYTIKAKAMTGKEKLIDAFDYMVE